MEGGFTNSSPVNSYCPKELVGLSPFEMLYGRPFVYVNDLFLDPRAQTLWPCTIAAGHFQQDIHLWGVNQGPKDSKETPLYAPGTQVLMKVERWVPKGSSPTHTPTLPCNTVCSSSCPGTRI